MEIDDFKAQYKSYFGELPADLDIMAESKVWYPFISDVKEDEVVCMLDFLVNDGHKKPRLGALKGALFKTRLERNKELSIYSDDSEDSADFRLSRTPPWNCSVDPPQRIRKLFTRDLPEVHVKELANILKGAVDGKINSEEAKRLSRSFFKPEWSEYTSEEQMMFQRIWDAHEREENKKKGY